MEVIFMFLEKKKVQKATLNRLVRRKEKLFSDLLKYRHFCMGNIVEKLEICGNPNCACRNKKKPKLHGPYFNLAYRGGDKTGMLHLTPEKLKYAQKMVQQYKKIWLTIREIACINLEFLRRKEFSKLED